MASYLQTLCLAENFRTSFDDLLSLASLFNGDVRCSLLALQVFLETGSTSDQKMAAPIYTSNTSTVTVATGSDATSCSEAARLKDNADVLKPSGSQPTDSGDEFVVVRRRKRRALPVASSDEDSQPPAAVATSTVTVIDDNSSSQGCEGSSLVNVEHSPGLAASLPGTVTDQLPVAVEAELAPPVHRLNFAAVGGLDSLPRSTRSKLQVS